MVFGQLVMPVQRRASAQHCTGMTNWPNTIQCLGSDDIMSPGIKSSALLRVKDLVFRNLKTRYVVLRIFNSSAILPGGHFEEFWSHFRGLAPRYRPLRAQLGGNMGKLTTLKMLNFAAPSLVWFAPTMLRMGQPVWRSDSRYNYPHY